MIKLLEILSENKILVPRRSTEERQKNYLIATEKRIQQYIKDGSKGNLDLRSTPITSLPDNLQVGGNLALDNTPITSLPNNLKVGGSLNLRNTKVTSLPDDLQVGGSILGFKPSLNELLDSDDDFNLDLGPEWGFTELRMGDVITPDMWDQEKLNSPGQFVITNPGWFLLPHKITDYKESFSTFITFDNGTKRLSEKFVKSFLKDNIKLDL
jgi:hypothetical protein